MKSVLSLSCDQTVDVVQRVEVFGTEQVIFENGPPMFALPNFRRVVIAVRVCAHPVGVLHIT